VSISPLSIFYFLSFFGKAFFSKEMVSVQWVLVGYSLAFSSDIAGFVGGLGFFGLNGVGMDCHGTIPHLAFMFFQLAFAAITYRKGGVC